MQGDDEPLAEGLHPLGVRRRGGQRAVCLLGFHARRLSIAPLDPVRVTPAARV